MTQLFKYMFCSRDNTDATRQGRDEQDAQTKQDNGTDTVDSDSAVKEAGRERARERLPLLSQKS